MLAEGYHAYLSPRPVSGWLLLLLVCGVGGSSDGATTTYSSAWGGGTILPGDAVVLLDGASVTGPVVANGFLEFGQTGQINPGGIISGTGGFAITAGGTVFLSKPSAPGVVALELAASIPFGRMAVQNTWPLDLHVGSSGTGSLTIANGRVDSAAGVLGATALASGSVGLTGGWWACSDRLTIGGSGRGDLTIDGGNVATTLGYVGRDAGGVGTVSITSGTLQSGAVIGRGDISIGEAGTGSLRLSGGRIEDGTGFLGRLAGGRGTAVITGGTWANFTNLGIGMWGAAEMSIAGGLVLCDAGAGSWLADQAGSTAAVTVTSGSWITTGKLNVGGSGKASIRQDGGTITAKSTTIGSDATGSGSLVVAGGSCGAGFDFIVGRSGSGAFTLTGGTVTGSYTTLGSSVTGRADVEIAGGVWDQGEFAAGQYGTATLRLSDGRLSATNASLATVGSSVGAAAATISGGTWAIGGRLALGGVGTARLDMTGGRVTCDTANASSRATMTITGGTLATAGDFAISGTTASLSVGGGGTVVVGGTLRCSSASSVRLGPGGTIAIGDGGSKGSLEAPGGFVTDGRLVFNRLGDSLVTASLSGTGTITKLGSGVLTLRGSSSFTGLLAVSAGTLAIGDFAGSGSIAAAIANDGTIVFDGSQSTTFPGTISGTGAVTKRGSGSVSFTGSSGFAGPLTVAQGTLSIGSGGTTGWFTGSITTNATLAFNRADDVTFTGTVSGTGGVAKLGAGRLVIAANQLYTGTTVVSSGTLAIGAGGTTGAVSGPIRNAGTVVFDRSDDSIFAAAISGTSGAIRKLGAGRLSLTGSSPFTGVTTVVAGTLAIGGAAGVIDGPIVNDATLVFDGSNVVRVVSPITGTGVLRKEGTGTLRIGGTCAPGGGTVIASGTLMIASDDRYFPPTVPNGRLSGTIQNDAALVFNYSYSSGTHSGIIGGTGSVQQLGGARLTLTGSNTFTGPMLVDRTLSVPEIGSTTRAGPTGMGRLIRLGNETSTGTLLYTGTGESSDKQFQIGAGAGVAATGGGVISVGGGGSLTFTSATFTTSSPTPAAPRTLTLTGTSPAISRVVGIIQDPATDGSGPLSLVKLGATTWALSGANSYTGSTTIVAGTLALDPTGSLSSSRLVTVSSTAVFDVTSVPGGYVVPGLQTLGGSGTVAGTLSVADGAAIAPGSGPGTLTVAGGVTLGASGRYQWQLLDASGTVGSGWDCLRVDGRIDIAANSARPFAIDLWTLLGTNPDVSGTARNFDATRNATWTIATASRGISGFAADRFVLRTSATNGTGGFRNPLDGGTFGLAVSGSTDLNLVFMPRSSSGVTIDVASGTQSQAAAGYPLITGTTPLLKTGAGTLVVDAANTLSGSTTIAAGTLALADPSALAASFIRPLAGGTMVVVAGIGTTVGGLDPNAGGLIDVAGGAITVAGGLSAADLVTAIVSGMGDGAWNGTSGITSSAAAAAVATNVPRSVGWLDNGDGSVRFSFAAPSDTNLDRQVDVLDAANFLAGGRFDTGLLAIWNQGDFTYDGVVDILDAASFLSVGLFDAGPYDGQPQVTAVPEPRLVPLVTLGLLALHGTRNPRRRSQLAVQFSRHRRDSAPARAPVPDHEAARHGRMMPTSPATIVLRQR
jgi:fibronectin-binding autotransporter adhesin